jgi:hypothetical protein
MLTWKTRNSKRLTPAKYDIQEIASIRNILSQCSYNGFFVFDLDNTLVESTQELGSHQWFTHLCEHAIKEIEDPKEAIEYALYLYHIVQHYAEMQAVEGNTVRIIRLLQDINIPVIALTSRGKEIIDPTMRQLHHVNIDFSRQWKSLSGQISLSERQNAAIFNEGIVFCSGGNKGECLNEFFNYLAAHKRRFPEHIIMVEDTPKNLATVGDMVFSHHSDFTGLHYNFLDEKVEHFNWDKAVTQLIKMSQSFNEDERKLLTLLNIGVSQVTRNETSALQSFSLFAYEETTVEIAEVVLAQEENKVKGQK